MKLLYCPTCQDAHKLSQAGTYCACGASWGRYLSDDLHAQISGEAVPLGFANGSLHEALRARPAFGMGAIFTAFVIPERCPTIQVVPHQDRSTTQRTGS